MTSSYYQAIAPEYARHRRPHPEVLRSLISAATLGPNSSVLELGCGTANYLLALKNQTGCACCGIDPSEAMLAEARKHLPRATFLCAPAEHAGFPDNQFDLVFAVDVVHHLVDRPRVFRKCQRILRGGGRLCIATDSPAIIRRREPLAIYFPETVPVDLARYPSPETLKTELQDVGFAELAEVEVEFRSELDDIDA